MKTIIAVLTDVYTNNGLGLLEPDYYFINKYCLNKKTLIVPSNISIDNLNKVIDGFSDQLDESVYESSIFQDFYLSRVDMYNSSMTFWNKIHQSIKGVNFFEDQSKLIESSRLFIQSLQEKDLLKRNFYREESFYQKIIGQIKFLKEKLEDIEVDVIVTNLVPAYFMSLLYPNDFRLEFSFPNLNFDINDSIEILRQGFYDYSIFHKASPKMELSMTGTCITEFSEKVTINIYLLENKLGSVSGIISDKFGLAAIDGILNKKDFLFSRRYLPGSIDFNLSYKITNEQQFYSAYWYENMMHPNFIFHGKPWINNILS